ncbi:hypothetical protein MLD38_038155 [Melastoma candidum]|uniref:Uncharacterized protein n=1 Tax=Melastoma candidum TaxID=119954 RepID=A0ACB9KZ72_9MYRT|nr:hypothetical protein MLD38_038155 [Melastoma candidum]
MGDMKSSYVDGKSRIMNWFKIGSNDRNSSREPPPARSDDDDDSDEQDNDDYRFGDTRKSKHTAVHSPGRQTRLIRDKDRATDTYRGGNSSSKTCMGCKQDIGKGTCREFMGAFFHPQCFCCRTCGRPIAEHEPLSSEGGDQHHKYCYEMSRQPTCNVCRRFISLSGFGALKYRTTPFWHEKHCLRHNFDGTPRCCSCGRFQPWDAVYLSLGDGRMLCVQCKESAILVTGECRPLYKAVREFMEGMKITFDRPVSFHLVDHRAIQLAWMNDGKPPVGMLRRVYTTMRGPEIMVLLLYGYVRLELGVWLTKELMDAWLLLRGYDDLPMWLGNSICWLVGYLWLESEVKSMASSSKKGREWEFEKKVGEYILYDIANQTPAARSGAFRATKEAVDKYGLHPTIEHIDRTGCLPR